MVRIVIADDSPQIRRSLREALDKHSGWKVCGEASNGLEAVSQTSALNPDIVILDLTMPGIKRIPSWSYCIHAAVPKLTATPDALQHEFASQIEQEARNSGFRGGVNKGSLELLIAGIESLLRGETFFTSATPSKPYISSAGQPMDVAEPTTRNDALDEAS